MLHFTYCNKLFPLSIYFRIRKTKRFFGFLLLTRKNSMGNYFTCFISFVVAFLPQLRDTAKIEALGVISLALTFVTGLTIWYRWKIAGKNRRLYRKIQERDRLAQALEEASRLLDTTDNLIETVANRSGFNSVRTFYRVFREQYHISPSDYRKLRKAQRRFQCLAERSQHADLPALPPCRNDKRVAPRRHSRAGGNPLRRLAVRHRHLRLQLPPRTGRNARKPLRHKRLFRVPRNAARDSLFGLQRRHDNRNVIQ